MIERRQRPHPREIPYSLALTYRDVINRVGGFPVTDRPKNKTLRAVAQSNDQDYPLSYLMTDPSHAGVIISVSSLVLHGYNHTGIV